jgi:hypothetical protein
MTAPNLKTPTSINGKTAVYSCTDTLASALDNAAASDKLLKVNTVRASNLTNNSATVDFTFYRSSTHTYFIKGASIPPNGSLVLLDRNEYIYVEEGDALWARANTSSTVDLTIHYEDIS